MSCVGHQCSKFYRRTKPIPVWQIKNLRRLVGERTSTPSISQLLQVNRKILCRKNLKKNFQNERKGDDVLIDITSFPFSGVFEMHVLLIWHLLLHYHLTIICYQQLVLHDSIFLQTCLATLEKEKISAIVAKIRTKPQFVQWLQAQKSCEAISKKVLLHAATYQGLASSL